MRRAIFLPGKVPRAGQTKTRLSPPLSLQQAADLYRAFLQDSVRTALSLGWERVALRFRGEAAAQPTLAALLPSTVHLQGRTEADLGAILAGGYADHFAEGFDRVVMIGSDNPTLPSAHVVVAEQALWGHDIAIGPSSDGGYYLLGMSRPHPALFEGIAWSTDAVFTQTVERASELGLTVWTGPEWYDVDTGSELTRLMSDLATLSEKVAPATREALSELSW